MQPALELLAHHKRHFVILWITKKISSYKCLFLFFSFERFSLFVSRCLSGFSLIYVLRPVINLIWPLSLNRLKKSFGCVGDN